MCYNLVQLLLSLSILLPWTEGLSPDMFPKKALRALGWKKVVLVTTRSDFQALRDWVRQASSISVLMSVQELEQEYNMCDLEGYVITANIELAQVKNMLACRRPSDSVMVITKVEEDLVFEDDLEAFNYTRSFYRLTMGHLFHHITLRDQIQLLQHEMACTNYSCSPILGRYDFKGILISGKTLSWLPWLQLHDCEVNEPCKTTGVLSDTMDILAHQNNFTWQTERGENWGVLPLTGNWTDPNATFGGIFGLTVRDERDLQLSIWVSTAERFQWMDSTMSILDRPIQTVINRRVQPIDLTMFIRPFTSRSWMAIGITLLTVSIALLVPQMFIKSQYTNEISHRITIVSAWVLFILINAFYGGALTMFFTSSFRLPFESLIGGLQLFPEWKMLMISGLEFIFERKLTDSSSVINKYWEHLQTEEGKSLIVPDYNAAMERLQKPGYFLYGAEKSQLDKLQKEKAILSMDLYVVSTEDTLPAGLGLPKYSPWTSHFTAGNKPTDHLTLKKI